MTFRTSLVHQLLLQMRNFMFFPGCGYWVWDVLYLLLLLVIMLEARNDEKLMFWTKNFYNVTAITISSVWWFRPEVQKLCQGSTEGLRAAKYDKVASTITKWFANPDTWSRPGVNWIKEWTNRTQNASSWLWTTPSWGWGRFYWNTKTRQGTTSHRCLICTKMSKICFFLCYTCYTCMIQIHDIVSPSEMEAIKQKTGNKMKVKLSLNL